jgi:hypothetical protein
MFVPVVDHNQHPLMPTTPSRARRWIKRGKATAFWKGGLFCVRLNVEPSGRSSQPLAVGIDPGSKREGYSVLSAAHTYLNIQAEARDGVKDAEKDSTRMRRTRRGRKAPCRQPRQNRKQSKSKLAALQVRQGYETKALRDQLGFKKTSKKLAEVWEAHCVDAWCLASSSVGGNTAPDNRQLVCIAPLNWHHRQLHRFQSEKGGKRKPYGGTLSLGIKRGTLVTHPRWGEAYVGGNMDGKLSLHDPHTGKRLTQAAKRTDCTRVKLLRWKTRLIPLVPAKKRKEEGKETRPAGRGHSSPA